MRTCFRSFSLLLLLLSFGALHAQAPKQASRRPLVLTNVTVVDATGAPPKPHFTVIITGSRIAAMGETKSVHVPKNAHVVNAAGKFLIPGLWDMHAHIFNQVSRRQPNTWYFPLFLANGVTGVREMWTKPEDMEQVRRWRSLHQKGKLLAPRIAAVGTVVDGPAGAEARNVDSLLLGPTVDVVSTAAEARRFVQKLKAAGIDFVKTYSNLSREAYLAIADECKKQGIPFAGHVPFAVDAAEASSIGQRSMEHLLQILESSSSKSRELSQVPARDWTSRYEKIMLDTFDEGKFKELVAVLTKNRTWQVPTLVVLHRDAFPGDLETDRISSWLRYIPSGEIAEWNSPSSSRKQPPKTREDSTRGRLWLKQLGAVRRMHQSSVPFLAGTDVGNPYIFPGFSLHDELALFVEAGFTPMEALQTATRNPAEFLGLLDSLGTVEEGKIADLVLLDADPLADIRNTQKIRAIVVNGRYLDRAELDNLLTEAQAIAKTN